MGKTVGPVAELDDRPQERVDNVPGEESGRAEVRCCHPRSRPSVRSVASFTGSALVAAIRAPISNGASSRTTFKASCDITPSSRAVNPTCINLVWVTGARSAADGACEANVLPRRFCGERRIYRRSAGLGQCATSRISFKNYPLKAASAWRVHQMSPVDSEFRLCEQGKKR